MTVTDRTDATEQEFRDRIAAFETAVTPPEVREAAVANAILRAVLGDTDGGLVLDGDLPAAEIARLIVEHAAAAAVAAYRATQDGGGAEEAARRVEALAEEWAEMARDHDEMGASNTAMVYRAHVRHLRTALAPQAGDGDGTEYDLATDLANRGLRACCGLPSAEHCP